MKLNYHIKKKPVLILQTYVQVIEDCFADFPTIFRTEEHLILFSNFIIIYDIFPYFLFFLFFLLSFLFLL
jgi:hypothetical protein